MRTFFGLNVQRDRINGEILKIGQKYVEEVFEIFGIMDCRAASVPLVPHLKLKKCED